MARIEGLTENLHESLTVGCPDCATNLCDFIYALIACDSIKVPALESFGYDKASGGGERRRWAWELDCHGTVSLLWKKAVVRDLTFDCLAKGADI